MGLTFAVADLHGRRDLLEAALGAIEARDNPEGDARTIVFLGDYVDRGPDSAGVIARLMDGPSSPAWRWICLKGNHEAMMGLALRHPDRLDWWLDNGGGDTVESYRTRRDDVVRHLPWVEALPTIHTDAHRVFVHAGTDPAIPLEAQAERTLLWKRYPKDATGGHGTRHVVHGHDPTPAGPVDHAGRTALDTLAWKTGRLVVAVFDDEIAGGPIDMMEISRPAIGI